MKLPTYVREGYIKYKYGGEEILPDALIENVVSYVLENNLLNPDKIEGWGVRRYLNLRILKIPLIETAARFK